MIPGFSSNRYPIIGPAKISGLYPTTEMIPTAVPVNAKATFASFKTAKYNARIEYVPTAKITRDKKNIKFMSGLIIPKEKIKAPINIVTKPKIIQNIFLVLSASKPIAIHTIGRKYNCKAPTSAASI